MKHSFAFSDLFLWHHFKWKAVGPFGMFSYCWHSVVYALYLSDPLQSPLSVGYYKMCGIIKFCFDLIWLLSTQTQHFMIQSSIWQSLSLSIIAIVCLPVLVTYKQFLYFSVCLFAGSFRYSCDICGKKYKYYSCFQEHRDLHAVDGTQQFLHNLNYNLVFNKSPTHELESHS